jgi:hypothetical protein
MDSTATAAMKTTHLASPTPRPPACGPCPPIVTCHATTTGGGTQGGTTTAASSSSGDDDGAQRMLLICLRGIVAFVWAASRSALQRMLIAYIQSTVSVSPTWHSFVATATTTAATAVRAGVPWLYVVETQPQGTGGTAVVAHRAVSSHVKKASWSYLRGTHGYTYPTPISCQSVRASERARGGGGGSLIESSGGLQHSAGVSLALSELCQEEDHFGGGRIPLSAILDLSKPSSQTSVGASWAVLF